MSAKCPTPALELNILEGKRVMIVGLGSFGSQIAIELAKAGVGHFALMDFDRVELHNHDRWNDEVGQSGDELLLLLPIRKRIQ